MKELSKEECNYEKFIREHLGLNKSISGSAEIKTDFGRLVNLLCMFDQKHKKITNGVTPMEARILDILARDNKEKLSIEIAEVYNQMTGKGYSRKDMSSCLAKMAKKNLIICRKESDSIVAKHLWSLPLNKELNAPVSDTTKA
jgi:uncharacterized protein (UPF0335 family)